LTKERFFFIYIYIYIQVFTKKCDWRWSIEFGASVAPEAKIRRITVRGRHGR
jgi:hypothetical protein